MDTHDGFVDNKVTTESKINYEPFSKLKTYFTTFKLLKHVNITIYFDKCVEIKGLIKYFSNLINFGRKFKSKKRFVKFHWKIY